jgi:hypothetical protein
MFTSTSRYYGLDDTYFEDQAGHSIVYKQRRFLPQGANMPLLTEIVVTEGERLDLIAARTLGDPEHFWRVCDANNAMNPFALTDEIGRVVRVSPPQFQETSPV